MAAPPPSATGTGHGFLRWVQPTARRMDGYPTPYAWAEWFCEHMGVAIDDFITRIEWRYLG